jgi:N-acetylmuramoyl-L-alanine amidase
MTTLRGKCSWFGGPDDQGVAPDEGLAFIYEYETAPHLFLDEQPPGTTGLARRLDPSVFYIATRWDYEQTPKSMLPDMQVKVSAPATGKFARAWPADWGPNQNTGRIADLSPGLMEALGIDTDDEVVVEYEPTDAIAEIPYYNSIAISSGHSTKCQGAVSLLNEVQEATRVVDRVAEELARRGVRVTVFHDTKSTSQNQNLNAIVNWHNAQERDVDISVHFNAHLEDGATTAKPVGTEVFYVTQAVLADDLSAAIADAGDLIDRGGKYSKNLFFLNHTDRPSVLIEMCFLDSTADVELYQAGFDEICEAIATVLGGPEPIPGDVA